MNVEGLEGCENENRADSGEVRSILLGRDAVWICEEGGDWRGESGCLSYGK